MNQFQVLPCKQKIVKVLPIHFAAIWALCFGDFDKSRNNFSWFLNTENNKWSIVINGSYCMQCNPYNLISQLIFYCTSIALTLSHQEAQFIDE